MFTFTVFEIFLFQDRSVLLPAQFVAGSERVKRLLNKKVCKIKAEIL